MCLEAALIAKVGDPGRKLHTGRSRNDQVALDLRLWLREACEAAARQIDGVLKALEDLAERDGDIILPGYTHLQRAQPICAGGELMAWHAMLARDRADLLRLGREGISENPLGSGAVAGSSLSLDRDATTASLEFARASASSIEATASRDEALDFLYLLARTAMHLSRWAEQWIIYASTEFGFLTLDSRFTTGSSMMPQKRNPDMLELIRGRCGGIYGHLHALLTICKGLPIAYNRDLQEDKRHVFGAYDAAMDCLAMAARIVATTRFNAERIGATLQRGYLDATSLAEYFVTLGVPFRSAHQIVGALVKTCESSGRHALSQLSLDDMTAALQSRGFGSIELTDDVYRWLGAENVVGRYRTRGHGGREEGGYRAALGAARAARRAGSEAAQATPLKRADAEEPTQALFESLVPTDAEDQRLVEAYQHIGRTLDDLPYTDEFERLYRAIDAEARGQSKRAVFHRLHNLRKAGRLPKVGRSTTSPPRIDSSEEAALRDMVVGAVGSLGQRDQLPYTDRFDGLVEQFNARKGRTLDPHDVWRLVAKLAK
jgi:argininosuccinate lyase